MPDRHVTAGCRQREDELPGSRRATRRSLGASAWIFGDLPPQDLAHRLQALGFDGVELPGDPTRYHPAQVTEILRDHNLSVFSLTPENVDLAHPDQGVRQQAIDYYLRLLDMAAELGGPLVSCHGLVGRVRAVDTLELERQLLMDSVREVAEHAQALDLKVVVEALNRYESHLLNTAGEAVAFVDEVGSEHVGILLDAYHMNIEEADPPGALRQAGDRLWLYHAADSNRQGIGGGHIDFCAQFAALDELGYNGPVILECTAPGPDPFVPIKDASSLTWVEAYLRASRDWLREQEE